MNVLTPNSISKIQSVMLEYLRLALLECEIDCGFWDSRSLAIRLGAWKNQKTEMIFYQFLCIYHNRSMLDFRLVSSENAGIGHSWCCQHVFVNDSAFIDDPDCMAKILAVCDKAKNLLHIKGLRPEN